MGVQWKGGDTCPNEYVRRWASGKVKRLIQRSRYVARNAGQKRALALPQDPSATPWVKVSAEENVERKAVVFMDCRSVGVPDGPCTGTQRERP